MQQVQINAPSNSAARVPAATNNSSHNGAAKPAVAPHQFLKEPAEETVETGPQRHLPRDAWAAVQQKQGGVQPALQKKESPGANVLQRKTNNLLQRPWAENYQESGLTAEGLFSDADLKARNTVSDEDRGYFAHEHIQKTNGSWIKEYGIPPAVEGGEWKYADMVKNKEIYEIKPQGGEDAVAKAKEYVGLANAIEPGHKLATAGIIRDPDPLLTKELTVINPVTRMNENDTYTLRLNYWKGRDGEILYRWEINNTSAEERVTERRKANEKRKRDEKNEEKKKEASAKIQKGQKFTIAEAFAKKKPTAKKAASTAAESPSATPETTPLPETEAPEAEAEEPAAEEESTS